MNKAQVENPAQAENKAQIGNPAQVEVTDDAFLGGRIRCLQPRFGFRAGLDTVMLAAACPARAGESVVEPGCGPGVAALCLAARTHAQVTGIEIEPEAAQLARENAARNDMTAQLSVIEADIAARAAVLEAAGLATDSFDHAIANPPYLTQGEATAPPHKLRARAFAGDAGLVAQWAKAATRLVRPGGTVTFIHRADALPVLLEALAGRAGAMRIFPLWPGGARPASRVIVRAVKGSRGPMALLRGLVLHNENDGRFTPQAWAVLGEGAALDLG